MSFRVVDVLLFLLSCAATVYGDVHYDQAPINALGWVYILSMTFGAAWIQVRTQGTVSHLAGRALREEASLTLIDAGSYLHARLTKVILRSLLVLYPMVSQAGLIIIHGQSMRDAISVVFYGVLAYSAIMASLCAVWERLAQLTAPPARSAHHLRILFLWWGFAGVLSAAIPASILGDLFTAPVYTLLLAPVAVSIWPLVLRHRYRTALRGYFQFD
jgi:hypothetical protein